MPKFLASLATVATSPYAFVAYLVVVVAWTAIAIRTTRLKTIARTLKLVPENDRKALLEKDYGFHLKEGMSASEFLRAQRASYFFYAFIAVLAACTLLLILAVLKPLPSASDPVRSSISLIVDAIDSDFSNLKGQKDQSNPDDPSTETFESKVTIPGTFYNYIEYERGEVPYFIASLYYGPDERVAVSIYNQFTSLMRQIFPDWLEHNQIMDKEKQLTDYTTFVKGKRKIIIDINRDTEDPSTIHVMITFKKPDPRDHEEVQKRLGSAGPESAKQVLVAESKPFPARAALISSSRRRAANAVSALQSIDA